MDTLLHDNIHKDIGNSRAVRQDEVDELRARIAALESQLAELNRILDLHITSGQQLLLKRLAAESQLAASEAKCAEMGRYIELANATVLRIDKELDTERAARAEAERLAVWAAKHYAADIGLRPPRLAFSLGMADRQHIEHDGTDAGILAALRQAEAKGDE